MGTATVTVTPPLEEVEQRFAQMEEVAPEIVSAEYRALADRGLAILRDEAPKRTGWFAKQIDYYMFRRGPDTEVRFTIPQPLGDWLRLGTGIFGPRGEVIRPRRAKALHFFTATGEEVFAAWVRGMKPNLFLDRARGRMATELGVASQRIGSEIIWSLAQGS